MSNSEDDHVECCDSSRNNELSKNQEQHTLNCEEAELQYREDSDQQSYPESTHYRVKDEDSFKLFVGQIPKTMFEKDLILFFEKFGEVYDCTILKGRDGPKGCAFLTYYKRESADKAIEALHDKCKLPGVANFMQVKPADSEQRALNTKLFVGMISKDADENYLREIFSPYGTVEECTVLKGPMNQSRRCAFVKYETKEQAKKAIDELNCSMVMNGCTSPIVVKFAETEKEKQLKKSFQMQMGMYNSLIKSTMINPGITKPIVSSRNMPNPMLMNNHRAMGNMIEMAGNVPINVMSSIPDVMVPGISNNVGMNIQTRINTPQNLESINSVGVISASPLLSNAISHNKGMNRLNSVSNSISNQSVSSVSTNQQIISNNSSRISSINNSINSIPSSLLMQSGQLLQNSTYAGVYPSAHYTSQVPLQQQYTTYNETTSSKQNNQNKSQSSVQLNQAAQSYGLYQQSNHSASQALWDNQSQHWSHPQHLVLGQANPAMTHLYGHVTSGIPSEHQNYQDYYNNGQQTLVYDNANSIGYGQYMQTMYPSAMDYYAAMGYSTVPVAPPKTSSRGEIGPDGSNLFIYHLPPSIGDNELRSMFSPFGTVISSKVYVDPKTNQSKCFGFISYDNAVSASQAIASMNGYQTMNKRLKVQLKKTEKQKNITSKPY